MLSTFFTTVIVSPFNSVIFEPLYNALVLLTTVLPGNSFGFSVILLTLSVRTLLMPLSHRAIVAQRKMRVVQPELDSIRKETSDREKQAKAMIELYKKHGINPFSGLLPLFIQLPIIFALYWVFKAGIEVDPSLLYSFIHVPEFINPIFLGYFDLGEKSFILATIVGITQFFQARLAMPSLPDRKEGAETTAAEDFSRILQTQMKYVLPVFIGVVSLGFPSALALYWATGNVFSITHELFVKRRFIAQLDKKEHEEVTAI
ncbi:MAG: YidC/Oxa1 family membrane protein insertase [bacterium]|nr:YidC/Oxa1 family membrane protein insertase [bacterium]